MYKYPGNEEGESAQYKRMNAKLKKECGPIGRMRLILKT
jgi:hypothetical protein